MSIWCFYYRSSTPASKNPHGGKHVTITVRETKTERMTPVNQGETFGLIVMAFVVRCCKQKIRGAFI